MNRIQLALSSADVSSQLLTRVRKTNLQALSENPTPHTLFVPLHYERNYAYPLIVWLHGPNDDERQLQQIMPLVSMRNYAAVGPRGSSPAEPHLAGYRWRQSENDIEYAQRAASECIDLACRRMNIARNRVFIGGYDCGGTMALRIALQNPGLFAGVISIAGPFPSGLRPLVNIEQARKLPLLIAQGRTAENYSVERVCKELRLFHCAGLNVCLRQYPCGDEVTTKMLHDMDVWIMEQVTGETSSDREQTLWLDEMN